MINDELGPRRRLILALLVFGGTAAATRVLADVLAVDGLSLPELGILLVFSLTFGWLAYGFWTALAGFLVTLSGRGLHDLKEPVAEPSPAARTALVVPVYHEDPDRVAARLRAIVRSLARTGQLALFDLFILSDSRDPQRIRAEEAAWARLRREAGADCRVFYRNRLENKGRKAGNIADFCRRWGRHYPYFVVLDADSVMAGSTLVRLVQLMEANPRAGLLQTLPQPVGGETVFARALQFAARLYGPVYAAGLSYWYPGRGNYWGHNAIIRSEAFMTAAGLPTLAGRPPLGGEILSHDFVEAALLQRAGWSVWLLPELGGSYEELPANLRGYLARDRRWCQGNLQHVRLLAAKGLTSVSRLHLAMGAMSYVVSLLWFLLLALTTIEAARLYFWPAVGMPAASLFFQPWPVADPRQLISLAWITVGMLLLPKLLPLALALISSARRRSFGGGLRLVRGAARRARVLGPARAGPDGRAQPGGARHPVRPRRHLERAAARRRARELGRGRGELRRHHRARRAVGGGGLPGGARSAALAEPGVRGPGGGDSARRAVQPPGSRRRRAPARLVPHPRGVRAPGRARRAAGRSARRRAGRRRPRFSRRADEVAALDRRFARSRPPRVRFR